ncbi:MAG: hypothetical protein HUU41_12680 [Bryobacteraceae bacterium]|nr:hypothetical protein [Bryobacterales bacterium]NUN01963.1 hypothetical protein [Bryobacteraceae bacterium]
MPITIKRFPYRLLCFILLCVPLPAASEDTLFRHARDNAARFDEMAAAMQRVLKAWLGVADPTTLLLPDRIPGGLRGLKAGGTSRIYTPHNSGADLYPYLILTAHLTDPDLYRGRMMEMLRNEVRYTTRFDSVPGNLPLPPGEAGPPSLFGAGEYAKDGLLAVTELLGRTPWYYRMVDMVADAMKRAPVKSKFGNLPAADAELNGDFLQALVRLSTMTGDRRFLEWTRRIADAYVEEVLPGSHGVPSSKWDFDTHRGDGTLRLRDHGNETVVGLTLAYALEQYLDSPRAPRYRQAVGRMLDRVLESANPDGMLYNSVDAATLKPSGPGLSDNWGYVYGAVYTFYQATGEEKYRDAVRRVLKALPKYRNYDWERGSFDGYADSIESAIYLVNREPVPEALGWVESEIRVMAAMQKPSGFLENWYGEGNFNRTLLLYILYKSQGCRPEHWTAGRGVGAVRDGEKLHLHVQSNSVVKFDFARHRRVLNFDKNYVRLNEFPEWYTVDENTLYRLARRGADQGQIRLGSELIAGIPLEAGDWIIQPERGGR